MLGKTLRRECKYTRVTDEYLLERGYKQYRPTPVIDSEYIVAKFQKRFDDDFGKKYFIDISKWSHEFVPVHLRDKWWKPFSYEYDMYVSVSEEENPIYLKFGTSWTLDNVEKFAEEFFDKMKPNYYETWDEC